MGGGPCGRGRASGQGHLGARPGKTLSRRGHGDHHVLRRRFPLGIELRRGAADGLSQCPLGHRRLQRHGCGGLADEAVTADVSRLKLDRGEKNNERIQIRCYDYFWSAGELRMVMPPTLSANTAAFTPSATFGLKLSISNPSMSANAAAGRKSFVAKLTVMFASSNPLTWRAKIP